jgi:hypothetical protein
LNFQDLISLIQATIAPDVLISGCALPCLVIQTRYGRVVDRIRLFNQEHLDLRTNKSSSKYGADYEKRIDEIKTEVTMLMKRGNYLKLSLFALFSSMLGFILTSFLVFFAYLLNASEIYPLAIATFSADLVLLIAGVLFAVREVAVSYAAVIHEVKSERY